MGRAGALVVVGFSVIVAVSCGGSDERTALETPPRADNELGDARPIIARGCLTGAGDRFVLTQLERGVQNPEMAEKRGERPAADPEPTTENYRLVGVDDQLRPLVGQKVEVTGVAEPEQVVDMRQSTPEMPPRTTTSSPSTSPSSSPQEQRPTGTAGDEPKVSTTETTRLEIADLRVQSVKPTGESCAEGVR